MGNTNVSGTGELNDRPNLIGDPTAGAQRSTDMQLNVKIRMEQADMPAGLLKLLAVLDQNITSAPAAAVTSPAGGPGTPPAPGS